MMIRELGLLLITVILGFSVVFGAAGMVAAMDATPGGNSSPWDQLPNILKRIVPPTFPDLDFKITDFGAVGDGKADCTAAIRKAIDACNRAGGGRVVVPAGTWLTGAIHLKSNVNLYVSSGAIIRFSQDLKAYLPLVLTRYEAVECMNYSPFIYAYGQKNIAITGAGTLDGQADGGHWWNWKRLEAGDNMKLKRMAKEGVPAEKRIFGEGYKLRVNFIEPYRCQNVLIEGVTIINSPMWEIEPVECMNVTVRKITVNSHGPNNDGCDPQSCTDVLIKDCSFDTGDDCIAIKAGRDDDGRRLNIPCQNVVIQGCHMKDGHGGITMGSETSGSIRNVFAENCTLDSPNLWIAIRIKSNATRGGTVEKIFVRNLKIGRVRDAVLHATMYYDVKNEGLGGQFIPVFRDFDIRNVTSENSQWAVFLEGDPRSPIQNVNIVNCDFKNVSSGNAINAVMNLQMPRTMINGKPAK